MNKLEFRVEEAARRLDRYIADRCPELSRSEVQRLIKEGLVLVNEAPAKASYGPVPGDWITVYLPQEETLVPEEIPLDILFEDEYLLVINKPAGLVVHPSPGHEAGTLVNALLAHRPDLVRANLDPQRPGIVHRLDRETSGVLVVAATAQVQRALQQQFKSREVEKIYLALVYGRLLPLRAAIEAPIGRDPRDRKKMKVLREGKYARTEYHVREHLAESTFLEATLLTGRTHQLRVHFASIGHPVVGDRVYGPRHQRIDAPRQMLHSWRLRFSHPITKERMEFAAPLPEDFDRVLKALRR
ncbi:MAG: RluA family pseudouridine synthase [Anaerolineae bacterium]|nr:RluA family pseudouridine synthase [Anaerolineae bacterium]